MRPVFQGTHFLSAPDMDQSLCLCNELYTKFGRNINLEVNKVSGKSTQLYFRTLSSFFNHICSLVVTSGFTQFT